MYENIPYQMSEPAELGRAIDAIAMADVYRARIRRTGNWQFLRYVIDLMTAGIAAAKTRPLKKSWVPYKYPSRISSLAITRTDRQIRSRISMKVGERCHVSSAVAEKEFLPFLKTIFRSNEDTSKMTNWLRLDEAETEYLSKG